MSFPQKVIASGMSLVLAFGLSPLGQVPAYAAQKGGEPAQQEAPLQAQDVTSVLGDVLTADEDGDTEATFTYNSEDQTVQVFAKDSGGQFIPAGGYDVTVTGPDNKAITATTASTGATDYTTNNYTFKAKAAGDYTIKISGKQAGTKIGGGSGTDANYYGQSKTITLSVAKLDISKLIFVPSASSQPTYTGLDQEVAFKLAKSDEDSHAQKTWIDWSAAEIEKANYDTVAGTETKVVKAASLAQGTDFESSLEIVHNAGEYDATITGKGSCTGTATLSFDVAQTDLMTNSTSTSKAYLTNVASSAAAAGYVSKVTGSNGSSAGGAASPVAIEVSAGKASNPIELRWLVSGAYTSASNDTRVWDALAEGTDYIVEYYSDAEFTTPMTGPKTEFDNVPYYAKVVLQMGMQNFKYYSDQDENAIYVKCTLVKTGKLSEVAAKGVLAEGTYLGDKSAAQPAAGGTFESADGADVSALVGSNFKVNTDFAVSSINTAATAKAIGGIPAGAGTYTGTISGDVNFDDDNVEIPVTYTVKPRVAKEGKGVGDLEITIKPGAYNGGNYVTMDNDENVKVQIYTSESGGLSDVLSEGTSALDGSTYNNWTVKYYNSEGKQVSRPSAVGDYKAVFSFSGNLEGTPDITKDFKVDTGDITTVVKYLKFKSGAQGVKEGSAAYWANPAMTYTGNALEISDKDLVLVTKDNKTADADTLSGTTYELSYAAGAGGATLDADGKPLTSGTYVITATFSGDYVGTVTGTLTVNKLNLRDIMVGGNGAELQFEQADGSWDTAYSAPATGSEIVPHVRIAVTWDKKQKTATPTLVSEDAYSVAFSNNTASTAEGASVTITPTAAHAASITASTAAQAGAFTITEKSFESVGASIELTDADGKATTGTPQGDSTSKSATVNLKLNSSNNPIVYSIGGLVKRTATVNVTGATVYGTDASVSKYYARTAGEYTAITNTIAGWATAGYTASAVIPTTDVATSANPDGGKLYTKKGSDTLYNAGTSTAPTDVYYFEAASADAGVTAAGWYKMTVQPSYAEVTGTVVASATLTGVSTAVEKNAAGDDMDFTGTAGFNFKDATVYYNSEASTYYASDMSTEITGTAYSGLAGTVKVYAKGKVDIKVAGAAVYTTATPATDGYYVRSAGTYYNDDATDTTQRWDDASALGTAGYDIANLAVTTTANADGFNLVTGVKDNAGADVTNLYQFKGDTAGKYTKDRFYLGNQAPSFTKVTGAVSGTPTAVDYVAGDKAGSVAITKSVVSADFVYANQDVYNNGMSYFKDSALTTAITAAGSQTYGEVTGTLSFDGNFTATDEETAAATNYSIRVLNSKGEDKTSSFGITCDASPYTSVAISGFDGVTAGEYTILVGAGTSRAYGGQVKKTFTVEAKNIADATKCVVTYNAPDATGATKAYTLSDAWAVDYNPAAAKTIAGILLAPAKATTGTFIKVNYEGTTLTEGTDYTLTYDANKAAGAAKVTIKGKGDYEGSIEQPFTINRINIEKLTKTTGLFQVDFVPTATFTRTVNATKTAVSYHTAFTNAKITPEFEVNYYAGGQGDSFYTDTANASMMLDDDYTVQWFYNDKVSYRYNSTDVEDAAMVKITATGNYEGSIEGHFYIDPTDLTGNSGVTVSPVSDQVWTGGQIIPAVAVSLNGAALTQGTDYVVTLAAGDNGTDEGEHTALIASAGQGNITVSTPIQVKYNIKKASEITYDLTGATVALSASKFTYNGKAQAPTVTGVTLKDGTLLDSALYTATIPSAKDAKTYEVTVKGATANVTGNATASFTIAKAANTLTVKAKKPSVKASKLKTKKATVKAAKAFSVAKNASGGKVTYKKATGSKKVKVASTGKVTVKKGTKKGTYTVKVKATSKATANYTAKTTAAFKLKVKVK